MALVSSLAILLILTRPSAGIPQNAPSTDRKEHRSLVCDDASDAPHQSAVKSSNFDDGVRLYVAPSWGNHSVFRINTTSDEEMMLSFVEWDSGSGRSNIVSSATAPFCAADYAYFTNLIALAGFWSLPDLIDDSEVDGITTTLAVSMRGQSHSVTISGSHTNTPLRLAYAFVMDSAPVPGRRELRCWPALAYFSRYDDICLEFSGPDLEARRDEWVAWRSKDDFFKLFGYPHEVRTSAEGVTWGYYLRDRGMMVVVFEAESGQRRLDRGFLTYSEAGTPNLKQEWLRSR